jgi:meso-butanediol dehydrogenase/(S,S)-butanediol dehydrogenase/diacetyl reductase
MANSEMTERPVVIVTGASQGVGRAVAERVARAGSHVVLLARRRDVLDEVVGGIEKAGGSAQAETVNVLEFDQLASTIASIAAQHGRLDGLVNNAARSKFGPVMSLPVEDFRKNFSINLDAVYVGMQAALIVMSKQGSGSIVNIGSVSGLRASQGAAGYGASKAALFHLGAIVALEAGPYNVRVNTVTPGSTWTPSFKNSVVDKTSEEIKEMEESGTILGRFGQPEEIADAVNFLLSDEARFITGVNLPVDGGAYWFRGGKRLIGKRR